MLRIAATRHAQSILIAIGRSTGCFAHAVWLVHVVQDVLIVKNFGVVAFMCTFITKATPDHRQCMLPNRPAILARTFVMARGSSDARII